MITTTKDDWIKNKSKYYVWKDYVIKYYYFFIGNTLISVGLRLKYEIYYNFSVQATNKLNINT